jgi:hypothetical protein
MISLLQHDPVNYRACEQHLPEKFYEISCEHYARPASETSQPVRSRSASQFQLGGRFETRRLAQAHSLRSNTEADIRTALRQLAVRKAEAIRRWRVEAQREVELISRIEREARPLARHLRDMAARADALPIQLVAARSPVAPASSCSFGARRPRVSATPRAAHLPSPLSDSDSARGCRPPMDFLIRHRRFADLHCEFSPADAAVAAAHSRAATPAAPAATPTAAVAAAAARATWLIRDAERTRTALEAGLRRAEAGLALAAQAANVHAQSQALRLAELQDSCEAQAVLEELLAEARRRSACAATPLQPPRAPGATYAQPQPYVSSPWVGGACPSPRAVLISGLGGRNAVTGRTTYRPRRAVQPGSPAQIGTQTPGAQLSPRHSRHTDWHAGAGESETRSARSQVTSARSPWPGSESSCLGGQAGCSAGAAEAAECSVSPVSRLR